MSFTLNDTGKLILLNVATQVGYIANSQGLSFMFIMIENNSLSLI